MAAVSVASSQQVLHAYPHAFCTKCIILFTSVSHFALCFIIGAEPPNSESNGRVGIYIVLFVRLFVLEAPPPQCLHSSSNYLNS